MRKIFNKKGYTLTYAIIVIGLLLILTGSVTFISYYNLKVARIGGQVNTSFYANDGAIEEALTELSQYTYNAEVKAWDRINQHTFIVDDIEWVNFLNSIYSDVNNGTDGFTIEKGNELIASALKGEFETTFFNELYKDDPASHDFFNKDGLTLRDKYLDYDGYTGIALTGDVSIEPDILIKLQDNKFTASNIVAPDKVISLLFSGFETIDELENGSLVSGTNGFKLTIKSDGTYHAYNKKLQVDLHVVAPDYDFSVAMLTENIEMYGNDIANYALVANENIVVLDGASSVNGDIYAYGNYLNRNKSAYGHIDVYYNLPRDHYGGVVIGYRNAPTGDEVRVYGSNIIDNFTLNSNTPYSEDTTGKLDVNGSVSTRNTIKLEVSKGSDQSYLKTTGDINANAVYFRNQTDNALLDIDENLMLYADLYMAGDNNTVEVGVLEAPIDTTVETRLAYRPNTGSIWGLHDQNLAAQRAFTRTGAIIINPSASNPSILANAIFLNGVIRYDIDKVAPGPAEAYTTGESLTTYKNSIYYQSLLSDNIYQGGAFAFLSLFARSGIEYDMISFAVSTAADINQVEYRSNHYYTMGYLASIDTENAYLKVADADKEILKIRNAAEDVNDQFYGVFAPGIVAFEIVGENAKSGRVYNTSKTSYDLAPSVSTDLLENSVDKAVNLLGFTRSDSGVNYREENLFAMWLDVMINDEDSDPSNDVPRKDVVLSNIESTSFGIYNGDETKDIYINFPSSYYDNDGNPKDDHIYIKGISDVTENLEGTIVSRGNVYVYAAKNETLNYTGNIISEKSIYLFGEGIKNFTHDKQLIYEMIHKNDGDDDDSSDDGLKGLYFADTGKKLSATFNSVLSDFMMSVDTNTDASNKVTINYVSSADPNGTSVIDSNSIKIDNWIETD